MTSPIVWVGVVGLGYWGLNLVRNFVVLLVCELAWACDGDVVVRERVEVRLSSARVIVDFDELLDDAELDAIVVAMLVFIYSAIAARVLEAGKHCLVEKPLAQLVVEVQWVVVVVQDSGRVLMVGHLLEYYLGVQRLKEIVDSGDLGDLHYLYSNRLNLGKLRADENALWSLGVYDVAVALALVGEESDDVAVWGECYMRVGVEDVVFCFLRFLSGFVAHLYLFWLDPYKEWCFTVVGSRWMATFDDMEIERKVTVYDKGFDEDSRNWGEYIMRLGDVWSPHVSNFEPLWLECEHFLVCVREGASSRTDGVSGLRVVSVLERLQRSLDETVWDAETHAV